MSEPLGGPRLDLFPVEDSVVARIAEAYLALLRDDPALSTFFGAGGIFDLESEDLLYQASLPAPAFGLVLARFREAHYPGQSATVYVTLTGALLTRPQAAIGTQRFLRARLLEHLYQVVNATRGELWDDVSRAANMPLTTALVQWEAVPLAQRLKPSNLLATPVTVTLQTSIDRITREVD